MEILDISISPDLSDLLYEEDEELEKVRREQDKEWMTLSQLAVGICRFFVVITITSSSLPSQADAEPHYLAALRSPRGGGGSDRRDKALSMVMKEGEMPGRALVRWEGSTHDGRIFREALRRQELNFPHPLKNKYYLVNSGYSYTKGYMDPYSGDNVRDIVITTMAIHNYIRKKCNVHNAFQTVENERYIPLVDFDVGITSTANNIDGENVSEESNVHWVGLRDMIASDICNA
ncbi:hypothetical protein FXO38_26555 [Capsicum annuum]|nr:hypothetical protein FXO38_26555 [Capsicum annuum]KAF3633871.1 hypothetical protein FXO37_26815 [Capsicum annuum]